MSELNSKVAEVFDVSGYEPLVKILIEAYDQAARGKGRARHSRGKPFDQQPILQIGRMTGPGGTAFQAMKKAQEAIGMCVRGEHSPAVAECLGAINYLAATIILIREGDHG